jgi:two-component sensor histidine kinase/GAF domain-containing protein
MASLRDEASRLRTATAPIDWATAVDAIVRRTPASASQPSDLRAQIRLLALLGSAAPLNVLLEGLATYVETWAEGLLCAVLLVDATGRMLIGGAAPSLPADYGRAIGPVRIAEGNGSCGSAAARREMIVVEDIEHSELWTQYAPIALAYGLRACWSVPILDDARELLGTLALYYRERRAPSTAETELIQFAASLAAFVMQRHRDAERVRTSEARLEAAVWGTDVGLWESNEAGDCRWFDNWSERFGVDPRIGHSSLKWWLERIHHDDVDTYVAEDEHCRRGTAHHYAIEYRIRDLNGAWRWVHERGRVTAWASDGTPRIFAGVCIDIDAQKQTEAALLESEERARAILDAIPDLMLRLNREGVFLDYRVHRSDDLFAPPEKILGARIRDLVPAAIADQVHEHIDKALAGRAMQEWEYQMESPRGLQDYEARMVACGTNDVVAIVRNITAFSEVDRNLRASLREKEVLLQEVHHRVKNNLQIISSLINMQLRRLKEASTRETLEQCQLRVQAIALIHEKLYQSKNLADVPFAGYVSSLAHDILKATLVSATHVALDIAVTNIVLPIDKAIPCGLILNELIANAVKHAFPDGRQGSIRIHAEPLVNGHVQLNIADNGVGLPAGFDIKRCASMGLQLVNTLAEQLDAQLEVHVHEGTSFQLTFPIDR